jgi:probable rRNA maturation factor
LSALRVELANEQDAVALDLDRLCSEIERAAALVGLTGTLSVALVDDERMRVVHRDFSGLDETTDVLAFPLAPDQSEIVISAETARRNAREREAPVHTEVLLYAVHGALHLQGHDDHDPAGRQRMQAEERRLLEALGHRRPD